MIPGGLQVRAVVFYPGWFVKTQHKSCEVWVLNPDLLPRFLKGEKQALDKGDIQAIEGCLSVYVRSGTVN